MAVRTPYRLLRIAQQTLSQQLAVRGLANEPPRFFEAPTTRFNAEIPTQRRISSSRVPLNRVKAVKCAFGVKLNDVVLALVSGAMLVAATPKPRLVKLAITPQGEESFSIGGSNQRATHYVVKVEIGGVTGLLAPLLGKQPPDARVWILGGEAPAFLKSEGPLYLGGPVWQIELTSPVWPRVPVADSKNATGTERAHAIGTVAQPTSTPAQAEILTLMR